MLPLTLIYRPQSRKHDMKFDFQPDTDEHINLDGRNFYASKYCKDHFLKQLTLCRYALMVLKKN